MNINPSKPGFPINEDKSDGFPSISRIIQLILRYWYLYALSIIIASVGVFLYHRYTIPIYKASTTLIFNTSEKRSMTSSDLIEGFGLSADAKNLENQTFIIKSYKTVFRTISKLDFNIEYFSEGNFKNTELYTSSPFEVALDSTTNHLINIPIHIEFLESNSFRLSINSEGGNSYNYKNRSYVGGIGNTNYSNIFKLNEPIQTPAGTFTIKLKTEGIVNIGNPYYFKFRSPESLTSEYQSKLGVSNYSESSSILFMTVIGENPNKLLRFLDQLGIELIEYNLEQKNQIAGRSLQFIQLQLASISDTLKHAQNRLLEFQKKNRFLEPKTSSAQLSTQYFETEKEEKILTLKKEYFTSLQQKIANDPNGSDYMLPAFTDDINQTINRLILDLTTLNNEIDQLKKETSSNNPYLTTLIQKSAIARANLNLAIDKILENIKMEETIYSKQMSSLETQINQLPEIEKKYLEIDRTYKLNDAIYTFLLQKNSETQITKASNVPDNEVVDQASINGIISPDKKGNYSKAIMLALLIPSILIAIIEVFNVRIRSKDDLTNLIPQLPLLGMIPRLKDAGLNIMINNPHSDIAEAFRSIRTRLNFLGNSKESRVFTVTSTNTGDGKTFFSVNLASAYAISGKKTALVGFDLRKPKLSELFKLNNSIGISNYLISECEMEDICYSDYQPNLTIIPAGVIPPNPSELIGNSRTELLFSWLRDNYEVIIIDSPPVGVVADARLLMVYSDAHLFLVRYNHTHKEHLKRTVQDLINENISSLGIIFNDIQKKEYRYGNYYSEYYGEKN